MESKLDSSSKPQVSIICAWFNRAEYIRGTLDSLLNQEFDSFEVIIANDGSPDPKVKEILDTYADPRLTIIHKENEGFTRTIAFLVKLARAPYIAIQGAGDISLPLRIAKQYNYMRDHAGIVAVGCWYRTFEVNLDGERNYLRTRKQNCERYIRDDFLGSQNVLSQGEVMFSLEAYVLAGGYRTLFKYAQDRDLWLRLTEFGDVGIVQECLYERNAFQQDGVSTDDSKFVIQRKLSYFARQCAEWKDKFGVDIVEKYGEQSIFFYQNRDDVNKTLMRRIVKYCLLGENKKLAIAMDFLKLDANRLRTRLFIVVIYILQSNRFLKEILRKIFIK